MIDIRAENDGDEITAPTGLTATAQAGKMIRLEFRSDASAEVEYEVWRRHGDTADWAVHATTRERGFEDSPVTPGEYYEYKVRATSGDTVSEFSPSAVVYGLE